MAVDIHVGPTGTTQYVIYISPADGSWWDTSDDGYETFSAGNYTSYDTAATEFGSTGVFGHTVPSDLPAGVHYQVAKTQAGGSPAQGDEVVAIGALEWDGTNVLARSTIWAKTAQLTFTVANQVDANALTGGGDDDPLENAVPGSYAQGTAGYNLGRLGTARVTIVNPVATDGTLTLYRGDSYTVTHDRALEWSDAGGNWPTLTDASVTLEVNDGDLVVAGVVTSAVAAPRSVRADVTGDDTQSLPAGTYDYRVVATFAGTGTTLGGDDRATLVAGLCVVHDREDA